MSFRKTFSPSPEYNIITIYTTYLAITPKANMLQIDGVYNIFPIGNACLRFYL